MNQFMMPEGLRRDVGATLREAREAKEFSIASAAMQTNLRTDIIEKLESNQFTEIGAPVFARGYLNIYARFLGLDDDITLAVFPAGETARSQETLRLNAANIASQNRPYRRSLARGWFSLIIVLILGGILISQLLNDQSWLMQQIRGTFSQQSNLAPGVLPTNANRQNNDSLTDTTQTKSTDLTVEVASGHRDQLPELTSIAHDTNTPLNIDNSNATANKGNDAAELTLSSLDDLSADNNTAPSASTTDNTTQSAAPDNTAQDKSSGTVLKTTQENWIKVTNRKGKVLYSKIYKAGAQITLDTSGSPYRLVIGRPDAVTLSVNGQQKSINNYRIKGKSRSFELRVDK